MTFGEGIGKSIGEGTGASDGIAVGSDCAGCRHSHARGIQAWQQSWVRCHCGGRKRRVDAEKILGICGGADALVYLSLTCLSATPQDLRV